MCDLTLLLPICVDGKSVWTLYADPMHFVVALRLDDNAAKVSVLFMVPLVLQLRTQLTDVWPTLLLLSWQRTAV